MMNQRYVMMIAVAIGLAASPAAAQLGTEADRFAAAVNDSAPAQVDVPRTSY